MRSEQFFFTKIRKQNPSKGDDANMAEADVEVGKGEQGEGRRANTTPVVDLILFMYRAFTAQNLV